MSLLRRILRPSRVYKAPQATSLEATGARSGSRATVGAVSAPQASDQTLRDADAAIAVGRFGDACAELSRAIAANPAEMHFVYGHGKALFAWGRFREALDEFRKAEAGGLCSEELLLHLGWAQLALGDIFSAAETMQRACAVAPENAVAYVNLGVALRAQRHFDGAESAYLAALSLRPDALDALVGLGGSYLDRGDPERAEACFHKAIAIHEYSANAWKHLGVALGQQERHDDALVAFERAAQLETETGNDIDGFINLAINHRDAGRIEQALQILERHLPQRPSVEGCHTYSHALLMGGHLRDGWQVAEFRWSREPLLSKRPDFERPVWDGQDLRGKTLLLRAEQGLGDTIQFIRYAPRLKALGATVLLRVPDALAKLSRIFPGIDRVLLPDDMPDFDYYCHLLTLPHALRNHVWSIPQEVPYLRVDPDQTAAWAARIPDDDLLNVGLVWAGSPQHQRDQHRSIDFSTLAPLASVEGIRWLSMQKGPKAAQARGDGAAIAAIDLEPDLNDLCDAAAAISRMGLVVCVDTAIAHLAGALGKPVWMLLPQPADWRWRTKGGRTPWYPRMRLFRQTERGNWRDVVDNVAEALSVWVAQGRGDTATTPAEPAWPGESSSQGDAAVEPASRLPDGLSAIAETRYGIMQYLPQQPLVGDSIRWYGEHLQTQLTLLGRLIQVGSTVVEVGAGIGTHALPLSSLVGAGGHLFLYEADPLLKRILGQNLMINRIRNMTLMRRNLADSATIAMAATDVLDVDRLSCETIDELQLQRLDWLKINDGTAASNILTGAANALWQVRPSLFVAATDELELTGLSDHLKEFSYRCFSVTSSFFNPTNFNRRDTDIFAGQTALALLAIPEEFEIDIALEGCRELI